VLRAYTPISSDDDRGFVDLLIKVNNAHCAQLPELPSLLIVVEWRAVLFL
jgi:hypothetical protein